MVLPPYVYRSDWPEMKAHIEAVFRATKLSCMLYNNPVAYGTDFLPEQIKELAAEHENFEAVKESSTDVRRVTWIRELVDDRLAILVGVDDAIVESIAVGAVGWVAGLVNALPEESVDLFNYAMNGEREKAIDALQLVSAIAANGYGAEVCAIDQTGAAGSWDGRHESAATAIGVERRGVEGGAEGDSRSAWKPSSGLRQSHDTKDKEEKSTKN